MTDERSEDPTSDDLDPGAYIGHEPEREAESIPGGVKPGDERIAAHSSRTGVDGEPDVAPTDDGMSGSSGQP